ncbi:helix-turn-helix transcriptional regulator [Methylomonas paludis]|uniref:Helix-turn-helix transcriptional regulator n=1 Tax=Methylomonas paludis TaxID=1173101 RepID=A0A975MQF5_9GAMM|nr:helix-turn-helix transcriptional regulator [Methylomonas paludis]QWF72097.1 helix-turn-helix transcriptional regulator [Methylomonas paludis]
MHNDEHYQPVPHDAAFRAQLLANPEVQAAFQANAAEYAILDEMLNARKEAGLTQAQVAERMGTKAPAVARLENSLASGKHSPSIDTLQKYAKALGKKLEVRLV